MTKFACYKTSIGWIKISYKDLIEKIELVDGYEQGITTILTDKVFEEIMRYLEGNLVAFDIYDLIELKGTDFEKSVWQALSYVPYGQLITYKELAEAIGKPTASRAVANAVGKNPFFIIIPCHRVIRSDGSLGGFAYGPAIKKKLLSLEGHSF